MNEKRTLRKAVALVITVAMVLGLSVTPTFAATSTPKTTITAATVYYNNNAKITWKKVSGAVKYQVYRKRADESSYKLMTTTTNTFYRSEDLKYNTKYSYKIKALNKSGKGQYSAVKSITTKKSTGSAVTILDDETYVESNMIAFSWKYDESKVVSYSVYRRTATSNYLKLDTIKMKNLVKSTGSSNDYIIPQNTDGYPYCSIYHERRSENFLTFADHDADIPTALKKKVSNQAKINKAYNTTYYYKVIATYADGSTRASKTVKIKTKSKNHSTGGFSAYDVWTTLY